MNDDLLPVFVAVLLLWACSCFATWFITRDTIRLNSINAGVAEYYLDKNHEKQFRYITNSPATSRQ